MLYQKAGSRQSTVPKRSFDHGTPRSRELATSHAAVEDCLASGFQLRPKRFRKRISLIEAETICQEDPRSVEESWVEFGRREKGIVKGGSPQSEVNDGPLLRSVVNNLKAATKSMGRDLLNR